VNKNIEIDSIKGVKIVNQFETYSYMVDSIADINYLWSISGGNIITDTNLFKVTVEWTDSIKGKLKVKVRDKSSTCFFQDSSNVQIKTSTSSVYVEKELSQISIIISPNPNDGRFLVKVKNLVNDQNRLEILTAEGKLIKVINNNVDESITINESLKQGIYFLRIISLESVGVKRFIVR
jgi:hypothetical protein